MLNPKKVKDMDAFSRGYDVGFEEGFKRGMEVARNSFAYTGRDRESILGKRKYGFSDEVQRKLAEKRLADANVSVLGSRKYGKAAYLHSEIENAAKEDYVNPVNTDDDCVCDCGIFTSCDD